MASHKFDRKTGRARVFFRYAGRQFNRTIKVASDREAERACALVEETIQDLERGKFAMPSDADPSTFLLSGGKVTASLTLVAKTSSEPDQQPTLKFIFDTYKTTRTGLPHGW